MPTTVIEQRVEGGEASQRQSSLRKPTWLFTVLKLGFSILAIVLVAMTVDLSAAWQRMVNQNLWLLAIAAAIILLQIALGGLRWHVILRRLGVAAAVLDSLRLFYIAVFFNACLWGSVAGDVVRAWLAARGQAGTGTAIASVVLDRVAAVAGVAVLVLVTAPLFIARVGPTTAALVPAAVAAVGLVGVGVAAQLHRLPLDWQRSRWLRGFQSLSKATRTIFLRPTAALPALGLAIAAQTAMALSAYALAGSLDIGLSLIDCLVLMQPVALITALPISIGGWGVRETAMIGLLGLVGVPTSAALALSVQLGLLSLFAALPGALLWLGLKHSDHAR